MSREQLKSTPLWWGKTKGQNHISVEKLMSKPCLPTLVLVMQLNDFNSFQIKIYGYFSCLDFDVIWLMI